MANVNVKQHDVDIENKIINLMFADENVMDILIENHIEEKDFSYPLNQEIFNTLIDIYKDSDMGGIVIGDDVNILYEKIETGDRNQDKEISLHINKLKNYKSDAKHLNMYIKKLRDFTKIRSVVQANRNVINYIKENENLDADELVQVYDESYQNVFADVIDNVKVETTADVVKSAIKEIIEDSMSETKVKFNLDGIDDYSKILKGYLTYIAGDSGLGKTTVGTFLGTSCAKNGIKVLYVNLETKNQDCIKKLISANCTLDNHRIKYAKLMNPTLLESKDWDILEDIVVNERLQELGIYWLYRPGITISELKREIVKHVRMYDIDIVIGDYYQLLTLDGFEDSPESITIPKISKALMRMAGQYYINPDGKRKLISHVWLSQCVKEIIYRQDKRPTKDDLYYGGVKDARLVLGIYRDEYYDENTRKPNILELGILKQNNGIAGQWFDYIFEAQNQIIRDMTDEEREILQEGVEDEDE